MRILLVEDHEEIWDFLSRRLKRRGFEVVVATDGQAGFDQAVVIEPDIILLDMNLPVLDGWTVAGMLRADPRTSDLPIIALTAHAMTGDREKAIAAGCTDYHPKPVDFPVWSRRSRALQAQCDDEVLSLRGVMTALNGRKPAARRVCIERNIPRMRVRLFSAWTARSTP